MICTYQYYDPYFNNKIEPEDFTKDVEQCEDNANLIYKANFLQAFNLTDFDDKIINSQIKELFNLLKSHEEFYNCMLSLTYKFLSEDIELGMMFLFSYDYFFATHKCLSEFLEKGDISKENIDFLNKIIN